MVSDTYVEWMNNSQIVQFTEQRFHTHTIEKVTDFVSEKLLSKNDFLFGIFYKDRHIGNIKLGPIRWEHHLSDISYFLGVEAHWGKGIAQKVVSAVSNYAFEKLDIVKINAGYYSLNYASARVLEKCGYTLEGAQAENFIYKGKRIDYILVAKFKSSSTHGMKNEN